MADNVLRREVQRRNDPFGIPACFYWTIDEVADWIESIGYGKYKENFRSHFINGRKLLTVDACVLPKMGITHFGDILALSKLIRDQLRIRNDRNNFQVYGLKKNYISTNHPCGKLHPNLSYMRHMYESEPIIDARLTFFRKRSIYYSGWSMEDWWDEKLRAEEKELTELRKLSSETDDKRVVIGNSQQERLQEAAMREISFTEATPKWPKRLFRKRVSCPVELPMLEEKNCVSDRIVGHLNMTPVKFRCKASATIRQAKEKTPKPADRPKPYLPIILRWEKMDTTVGYPQLKVNVGMLKCGFYTG